MSAGTASEESGPISPNSPLKNSLPRASAVHFRTEQRGSLSGGTAGRLLTMAMGKRKQRQEELFILADGLPMSQGHPFYRQLNALLAETGFDRWIEKRCQRYYEQEEKR